MINYKITPYSHILYGRSGISLFIKPTKGTILVDEVNRQVKFLNVGECPHRHEECTGWDFKEEAVFQTSHIDTTEGSPLYFVTEQPYVAAFVIEGLERLS